ncbi:MAG: alginate lyase [Acidobacteria bacterium]|nr:MAG: alginate lyase [Acidobacteriota bacterium]
MERELMFEITPLSRRSAMVVLASGLLLLSCSTASAQQQTINVAAFDCIRVLKAANQYLSEKPFTVTASPSSRSAGGLHDFFSEGDYWWPDPANPKGPYIQRDGMTNPDNFVEHRRALMRLSVQVPTLVAAWRLTKDKRYASKAAEHLRAWFVDERTRMNPNLQYAQAIHGVTTGRGIGIIDTIHLVEVTRAIEVLKDSSALSTTELGSITQWFKNYLVWMSTSKNGTDERDAKNNHGTCWLLQVAAFAHLVGDQKQLDYCRERFKTVTVPNQIAENGSFPEELRRTKPYGYSLFNLEAMATVCQILSTPKDNLFTYETANGRSFRRAMEYMAPFIGNKKSWPLKPDVMYDKEWPMRQASLLFAGIAFDRRDYIELWKTLPADSNVEEVIRNFFIRQPVLWVN